MSLDNNNYKINNAHINQETDVAAGLARKIYAAKGVQNINQGKVLSAHDRVAQAIVEQRDPNNPNYDPGATTYVPDLDSNRTLRKYCAIL
ncbi:unnamed protein product [Gordionus sp. m RMFG-2023]